MFFGVDVFPEKLLGYVSRMVISHDPKGPLTLNVYAFEDSGQIELHKFKARQANYAELLYVVGADPKARSVMIDLPLIGACTYSTSEGSFLIEGEEQAKDLAKYLRRVAVSVR
jgi:hypothetical protein